METMKAIESRNRRAEMVERYIAHRGVRSERVLAAMNGVPREDFLPPDMSEFAYDDAPLPLAEGQTISQPYIVAMMTEALQLQGGETVLEIGTGSGYAAAVLSQIAKHVYTVERIGQLAEKAAIALKRLRYGNVRVLHGDGTLGWPDHAPYDAIVVAAGGPQVPESLKAQLKIGGRLVIPVGHDRRLQELIRVTRLDEHRFKTEELADVRFVPLVGAEGWSPQGRRQPTVPDDALEGAIAKAEEFVICGYTKPAGSRQHFGALLLGAYDQGQLRYVGKVGTGFDESALGELYRQFQPLIRSTPALLDPPREKGVVFLAPELVAQISFQEWTADRKLRQPVYLGLRRDKSATDVRLRGDRV
jgi:protein-L-isoaspartate(D-aspartate) O-methyltransferase